MANAINAGLNPTAKVPAQIPANEDAIQTAKAIGLTFTLLLMLPVRYFAGTVSAGVLSSFIESNSEQLPDRFHCPVTEKLVFLITGRKQSMIGRCPVGCSAIGTSVKPLPINLSRVLQEKRE